MNNNQNIVVIGAGQSATSFASLMRQQGFEGSIKIFGDEGVEPYQRPPLSKAYLMGATTLDRLQFRAKEQWEKDNIELFTNDKVVKILREDKMILTQSGQRVPYDKLIIATGSRVRKMQIEGSELSGIHYLKSIADSDAIKEHIERAKKIAIIGAGYIGLEVAAIARKKGLEVHVIELAPRVLARVACEELSEFYENLHKQHGVIFHKNSSVTSFKGEGAISSVILNDGLQIDVDMAVVGIGVIPNDELAKECGLICENGINTDENAITNDENIYACGDCTNRTIDIYQKRLRLESVHNAIEQSKLAAAHILGKPMPRLEVPWFWSDQYDCKLQIAGIFSFATKSVTRGDKELNKFAIFHLNDENRIVAVDAVNSAPEFLVAKNLIMSQTKLAPEIIKDMSISPKAFAGLANK